MAYLQQHLVSVTLILMLGSGLFVRLVAKEKHRRDKHLLARLQAKEEQEKQNAA